MYTDFYQFSEKPFEDNPDPKFLYLTPSYQEALASILTWIREGQGFSAITGEAGTGKTYFIHTLVNHVDEKVKTIFILNPTITFKELLKQILFEFNQPVREKTAAALFHQFTKYLDHLMTEDKTLLIIFDEAQGLNDKILEEIARFFDLRSKLIRIIFVGQPHFDERLSSPGLSKLGKRIKIKHRIKSFTEVESRGYINHRLRLVGSTSQLFTPKAISMICFYTQGIPSLINHVCDNAFRVGFTMNQGKIDIDIIEEVIQNLAGPGVSPKILRSIPIRQIRWFPIRFPTFFKRISIAVLFSVFLVGVFFLFYEYLGRESMKIQGIKSFIESKLAMKPFTHKPSAKGTIESILTKDRTPPSDESELTQPESSSLQQDAVLITPGKGKQQLTEVIVVKRGETLSLLAKNYYHIANPTLIDFILQSNLEITNADLIKVDQKIKIPKITEESLVSQTPDHTFKILVGTFWSSELPKLYRDEPVLKGKTIEIIPLRISPTEIWYRVLVGNFQNKDEALNMVFFLKKKGLLASFESGLKAD